jgi:large subunit ribosomal protein L44
MFAAAVTTIRRSATLLTKQCSPLVAVSRGRRAWTRPFLQSLYKRRLDQGPDPERPRSVWINWNYDAEIYSFGKRLGEVFKTSTLKQAFITSSYIEQESEKRSKLSVDGSAANIELMDNKQLSQLGEQISREYIEKYLKYSLPLLPEVYVKCVASHLLSTETLAHIASNLGIKDLVQTAEFPVSAGTLCSALKAVIGALHQDQGSERSGLFVQDFIIPQLIGKDILDLCSIHNPMGVLVDVLKQQGLAEPEPRLLWSTGSETIMASYVVGIYCDRQLIGQAPGETTSIGEEMAARDALRRLWNITESRAPLPLGRQGHSLQFAKSVQ